MRFLQAGCPSSVQLKAAVGFCLQLGTRKGVYLEVVFEMFVEPRKSGVTASAVCRCRPHGLRWWGSRRVRLMWRTGDLSCWSSSKPMMRDSRINGATCWRLPVNWRLV